MLFSIILQAFILFSGNETIPPEETITTEIVSAASNSVQMEEIKGYDEVTAMSFSHSLPVVGAQGFGPQRINEDNLGVLTTADSVLVVDRRTSSVLYDKASDNIRPIASITKLMTAYTLLDLGVDFQKVITISPNDYRPGGIVNVYSGEQFAAQDLWMTGLIASDNVAIVSLVNNFGGGEEKFVQRMNELAKEIGMENSSFSEPTGISRHNVSTARDLAILIDLALNEVKIEDAVRRTKYVFTPINKNSIRTVSNTNKLLSGYLNEDPYRVIGGKTGFTYEAGYCLGAIIDGPESNDEIIAIVLGADTIIDRFQELKGLVNWTFNNFEW